jgi:hypothetical protein
LLVGVSVELPNVDQISTHIQFMKGVTVEKFTITIGHVVVAKYTAKWLASTSAAG